MDEGPESVSRVESSKIVKVQYLDLLCSLIAIVI